MKTAINIIGRLAALGGSLLLTNLCGKYIIAGVTAERGYEAFGGEIIMVALIFACMYYTFSRMLIRFFQSLFESMFIFQD